MSIDWHELEDRLHNLCAHEIERFALLHQDETFYGFALGCNSEYGDVLLYLNTPDDLRQTAVRYSTSPPNQEAFDAIQRELSQQRDIPFTPEPLKTVETNEKELRWSLGDWKYQGFNDKAFDKAWRTFARSIHDAVSNEDEDEDTFMTPTQARFMRAACRVLVRLESDDVFSRLQRTGDFQSWVSDHDEPDEDSRDRLETVRGEMTR